MDFNYRKHKDKLWITPAIVALLIALIPTINLQWPLSTDIFYHIHIAQIYSQYGFTMTDPELGMKISYPPLFSLVQSFLVKFLNNDYLIAAKLLQPTLAFLTVLSVSYVAKKFYGNVAGISAGFLMISSYLFSRLVSPLPETMALVFIPLVVYYYYKSINDKNYLYALISGILFIFVVLTHQAATLIIFLVITAIGIVLILFRREFRFLMSYAFFLSVPIILGILGIFIISLMNPNFIQNIITNGFTAVTGINTQLTSSDPISAIKYITYLGLVLVFAIVGFFVALRKRRDKDIIVLIWIITIFLISISYLFGINVFTLRVLIYLLIPLAILGGLGLSYLYHDFRKKEINYKVRSGILIAIFVLGSLFTAVIVSDPNFGLIPKYDTYSKFGSKNPQIAPPTDSDVGLADWLNKNSYKNSNLISNNYYTSMFLLATTGQPIANITAAEHYIWWGFKNSELSKLNAGYFVYDKRLFYTIQSKDYIISDKGQYLYFPKDYNIYRKVPSNFKLVYENKDYMLFKISKQ